MKKIYLFFLVLFIFMIPGVEVYAASNDSSNFATSVSKSSIDIDSIIYDSYSCTYYATNTSSYYVGQMWVSSGAPVVLVSGYTNYNDYSNIQIWAYLREGQYYGSYNYSISGDISLDAAVNEVGVFSPSSSVTSTCYKVEETGWYTVFNKSIRYSVNGYYYQLKNHDIVAWYDSYDLSFRDYEPYQLAGNTDVNFSSGVNFNSDNLLIIDSYETEFKINSPKVKDLYVLQNSNVEPHFELYYDNDMPDNYQCKTIIEYGYKLWYEHNNETFMKLTSKQYTTDVVDYLSKFEYDYSESGYCKLVSINTSMLFSDLCPLNSDVCMLHFESTGLLSTSNAYDIFYNPGSNLSDGLCNNSVDHSSVLNQYSYWVYMYDTNWLDNAVDYIKGDTCSHDVVMWFNYLVYDCHLYNQLGFQSTHDFAPDGKLERDFLWMSGERSYKKELEEVAEKMHYEKFYIRLRNQMYYNNCYYTSDYTVIEYDFDTKVYTVDYTDAHFDENTKELVSTGEGSYTDTQTKVENITTKDEDGNTITPEGVDDYVGSDELTGGTDYVIRDINNNAWFEVGNIINTVEGSTASVGDIVIEVPVTNNNDLVYTDKDNNESLKLTELLSYSADGFGLLGDAGLIALFTGLFSFLPNWLWLLFGTCVASVVIVVVFNVIRGR